MFRISQFMQELVRPTALVERRSPAGPVVIWNLIRRCNLTCKHCYSISADIDFKGELSTDEVFTVMDDLRSADVDFLTIGQYLQPTRKHHPVVRFVTPTSSRHSRRLPMPKAF